MATVGVKGLNQGTTRPTGSRTPICSAIVWDGRMDSRVLKEREWTLDQ